MNFIKRYTQYNESKGVAQPTVMVSDFICEELYKHVRYFLDRKSSIKNTTDLSNFDYNKFAFINIPRSNRVGDWMKFPVNRVELSIKFQVLTDEEYCRRYPITSKVKKFNSWGACSDYIDESAPDYTPSKNSSLLQKDKTLFIRLEAGAFISDLFNESDVDGMNVELESAILHELNHAYEGYQLFTKFKQAIPTGITSALEANKPNVPKEVWRVWEDDFTLLFYWAEPHEVRAMVQEALPYVKRSTPEEMKSKAPSLRYSKIMADFKYEKFLKDISDKIKESMPGSDPLQVLTDVKNGFADELEEYNTDFEQVSSVLPKDIKRMPIEDFLKFSEDRIHKAGEKIRRGILRLYTHNSLR